MCEIGEKKQRLAPIYALYDWKVQERKFDCFNLINVPRVGRCNTSRANKDRCKGRI